MGQIVYAQSAADDPCDLDYYESLKSRAWLEAQREITQNQNLIFKPDSVLEYTCFDLFSAELAEHAEDMFSETDRWGTLLGPDSMDKALESLVGVAFRNYLTDNFENSADGPYDLLGGRLNDEGIDYDSSKGGPWLQPIVGDAYSCDIMNQVWMQAKCMELIDDEDEDGFFTFTEYQNDPDKRFLPERCTGTSDWEPQRKKATEEPDTPWTEDNVDTYLNYLDNGTCGSTDPDDPAGFPTGLVVRHKNNTFLEHICIQPGCHYQPSGYDTGDCVSS